MSTTEIQQVDRSLEDSATTPEQKEVLQKKMDEIYGNPNTASPEGEARTEHSKIATSGVDDQGRLVHMSNESGTLNLDQNQLKDILKSPEGKHTIKGEDGKEFNYTRDAEGVTIYTPDGKVGVRLDNDGKVVKEFSNEKQNKDIKIWDAPNGGGKNGNSLSK